MQHLVVAVINLGMTAISLSQGALLTWSVAAIVLPYMSVAIGQYYAAQTAFYQRRHNACAICFESLYLAICVDGLPSWVLVDTVNLRSYSRNVGLGSGVLLTYWLTFFSQKREVLVVGLHPCCRRSSHVPLAAIAEFVLDLATIPVHVCAMMGGLTPQLCRSLHATPFGRQLSQQLFTYAPRLPGLSACHSGVLIWQLAFACGLLVLRYTLEMRHRTVFAAPIPVSRCALRPWWLSVDSGARCVTQHIMARIPMLDKLAAGRLPRHLRSCVRRLPDAGVVLVLECESTDGLSAASTAQDAIVGMSDSWDRVLHRAVAGGAFEPCRVLLGESDTVQDTGEWTCLHAACQQGHADMVTMLLRTESDPNARTSCGSTPLHLASACGCGAAVQALLDAHVDVDATDDFGDTALHEACRKNHAVTVDLDFGQSSESHTTANCFHGRERLHHLRIPCFCTHLLTHDPQTWHHFVGLPLDATHTAALVAACPFARERHSGLQQR